MYCSQCGNELTENSKFCGQCGANLATHPKQDLHIDVNRVIKQAQFKLWKKKKFGWPEKGTLTLYNNRLEWNGGGQFTIPIDTIVDVSAVDAPGQGVLKISDGDDLPYTFVQRSGATMAAGLIDPMLTIMASQKVSDVESWREAIDKYRFA